MTLVLASRQLVSRVIRRNVNAGVTGSGVLNPLAANVRPRIRRIDFVNSIQQVKKQGNLLDRIWNGGKKLIGWLTQGLNFLAISVSAVFGWLVSAVEAIKAFDWNASDKALQQSQQNLNVRLATIWGGLIGQGIGWFAGIAVGYGVSLIVPVIGGAALAKTVANAVALEGLDELSASLLGAIRQTIRLFAGQAAIGLYINYRRLIKNIPREILVAIYGEDTANFIQDVWGQEGGPNYSFNAFMDEQVEAIENPALEAFVEELLEESWDSFIESGFIVAQQLDEAYAQTKLAQGQGTLGTPRTAVITPDRRNDSEVVVLHSLPQNLMMPAIQQTVTQYRALDNRDVGQIVGMPVQDYARVMPLGLRLKIKLYSVARPPYSRTGGRKLREVTVSIPDLKPGALDWEQIKAACGGSNGYLWGRFKCICRLSNGRIFTVYANSESEARQRATAFLSLSTAEIETINVSEELKAAKRLEVPGLQKDAVQIYPAYFTVINRDRQLAADLGRPTKNGRYRDREERIELWPDRRPSNFAEIRASILAKGF